MAQYYWKMSKGGDLLGPTLSDFWKSKNDEDVIKKEIAEIMGVKKLPAEFSLYERGNSDKRRERQSKTKGKDIRFVRKALNDLPYEFEVKHGSIYPKIGNHIWISTSHHVVIFDSYKDTDISKMYRLDDSKQKEKFRKEVERRIQQRIKRQKRTKNVKGRTTNIGSFCHVTENTIQNAEFAIYLDADQEITEAEPHIIGSAKFYKRSPRHVMFDIDEHKILTRDGKEEIMADNTEQVIEALLKCLAGAKNGS